jgi:hypothetical protein
MTGHPRGLISRAWAQGTYFDPFAAFFAALFAFFCLAESLGLLVFSFFT